jgi:hypothetical protein
MARFTRNVVALAECEAPQIKKTLRACLIEPRLILEAKTKQDLIDLAEQNGIFSTLDEWTIEIMRAAKEAGKSPLDAMLQATRETRGPSKKAAHKSPMAAAQAELASLRKDISRKADELGLDVPGDRLAFAADWSRGPAGKYQTMEIPAYQPAAGQRKHTMQDEDLLVQDEYTSIVDKSYRPATAHAALGHGYEGSTYVSPMVQAHISARLSAKESARLSAQESLPSFRGSAEKTKESKKSGGKKGKAAATTREATREAQGGQSKTGNAPASKRGSKGGKRHTPPQSTAASARPTTASAASLSAALAPAVVAAAAPAVMAAAAAHLGSKSGAARPAASMNEFFEAAKADAAKAGPRGARGYTPLTSIGSRGGDLSAALTPAVVAAAAPAVMAAAAAHLGSHAEQAMPLDRTRRQPPALQAASVVRQQSTDSLNISMSSSAEWDDVLFRGQVPSFVERSARSYPVPKSSILADDDSRGMPEEVFGRVVDQHGVRSKPKPKPLPSPTKAPVTDREMYGETMREYGLDIEDLKTARKAAAKAAQEARETANLNRGSSTDDRGGKGERIAVAAAMADLGLSLDEIRNAMRHRGTSTLEDEPEDLLRKAVTWDEEVARAKKWALRGAQTNWARFD